jgi:Flp pilus assembly protein TadG
MPGPSTIASMLHHFRARLGARLARVRGAARFAPPILRLLPRFSADRRANVAMIFALTSIPIIFATGMGVDYTMAARRQTKLNAAADAAALAAVTPSMLSQNTCSTTVQCTASSQSLATTGQSAACDAAVNMFCGQASTVSGVSSVNLTVNVTQPPAINTPTQQQAAISYTAQSQTAFSGIIGRKTINIAGSSTALASTAPNINFYVLADDSPSMAIPATTVGINAMMTATANSPTSGTNEGGCAFACHEADPAYDNLGNPGGEDNYALARSLGLTLRIDNLTTAIENLASTAATTATSNKAIYELAIYTFDTNANTSVTGRSGTIGCTYGSPLNTIASLTSNMTTASNDASNITMLEVYNNSGTLVYYSNSAPTTPTAGCNDSDGDTDIDDSLTGINSIMPTPGNGTNAKGDGPQEVLFFVTDGVEDYMNNGARQISLLNTANCTAIKNRVSSGGLPIRIAVLYLDYLPLPSNAFYTANVEPFEPNIGTTLQSCASPGLYQEVTTDQDISTALATLFINAVNTAHLTQ